MWRTLHSWCGGHYTRSGVGGTRGGVLKQTHTAVQRCEKVVFSPLPEWPGFLAFSVVWWALHSGCGRHYTRGGVGVTQGGVGVW